MPSTVASGFCSVSQPKACGTWVKTSMRTSGPGTVGDEAPVDDDPPRLDVQLPDRVLDEQDETAVVEHQVVVRGPGATSATMPTSVPASSTTARPTSWKA